MVTPGSRRLARVAESIRVELAQILIKSGSDESLSWVTITGVEPTPDLKYAKVFFFATGQKDQDAARRSLEMKAPILQRDLARRVKMRNTPRLSFHIDTSFDTAQRIDELLGEAGQEKARKEETTTPEQRLAQMVAESESILVACHRNPDGDAIGSLLGMSGFLRLMGKQHVAFCPDGVPPILSFLAGVEDVVSELDDEDSFDLTIVVDTADEALLPDGFPEEERRGTLVVIDHHQHHGEVGDLVIRRDVAAVGQMLYELSKELVWPMDEKIAESLYASIVADTGSFRYSSTTPETHRVAAELIEHGARPWVVATALYESFSINRQRLLADVLRTLELSSNGRFAHMFATPKMLEDTGTSPADLDGMVNLGRAVDTVEISALFRVESSGEIKVSFRSKGRMGVADLARKFGGGGHRNAAGCTIDAGTTLEEARRRVSEEAKILFAEHVHEIEGRNRVPVR